MKRVGLARQLPRNKGSPRIVGGESNVYTSDSRGTGEESQGPDDRSFAIAAGEARKMGLAHGRCRCAGTSRLTFPPPRRSVLHNDILGPRDVPDADQEPLCDVSRR